MPTLRYYIHQLRILPAGEIARRMAVVGKQLTIDRIGKTKAILFGTSIPDRQFFEQAFGAGNEISGRFLRRARPLCFTDPDTLNHALLALSDEEEKKLISKADRFCDHTFDLLGSGEVCLGPDIDWHRDFKTGYRWNPETYYRDVTIPYGEADVKMPWELSRFMHAVTLGQAYRLTGNEKYAREFVSQVSDWIDTNKPQFGVNWVCAMDVAIRTCNWIAGFCLFHRSPEITDDFVVKFTKSLYQHGLHIIHNLENRNFVVNNHFIANLAGLTYLGVFFPEFRTSGKWKRFGIEGLKTEMMRQVYADGCDFEASTCYHRLALELFFFPTLVTVVNHELFNGVNHSEVCRRVFGDAYTERLRKMFIAVLYLLKPNGRMPQIGDNDNGMLHVFADRDVLDMRYLLALGAVFFKEPAFKVREFGFCEEALWIYGPAGRKLWDDLPERSLAEIGSIAFPDAGWYIMRNKRDYLIVSCGPNGQNDAGGHSHNDKLSFELCIDGCDAIVDPGTYIYTSDPAARNEYRSTEVHNTVAVDDCEQNEFIPSVRILFAMKNQAHASVLKWETGENLDTFVGEHRGYQRFQNPVTHRRKIRFHKSSGRWEITDSFIGLGFHDLAWNLTLAPDIKSGSVRLDGMEWQTGKGYYSSAYGKRRSVRCLKALTRKQLPWKQCFAIMRSEEK